LGNLTFQIPGERTPGAEATQEDGPTTIAADAPPAMGRLGMAQVGLKMFKQNTA
jgi:hypothetical protein